MPSLPSDLSVRTYKGAHQLPKSVVRALQYNARNANVILPQTLKALAKEQSPVHRGTDATIWITCSSQFGIEFILAVTDGYMGPYPVFIYTTLPFDALTADYIQPCIVELVKALDKAVSNRRIYAVFAPEPVTLIFAEEWTRLTGIRNYIEQPFYAAKISYCTLETLDKRNPTIDASMGYSLRPATPEDIPAIGELCYLFASDSPPYCLSTHRAMEEATILVKNHQVWVHEAQIPGRPKEIASIVAFTRNSEKVGAITKVCTNSRWRRRGCAERLVRRVCKHLLTGRDRKESVVLYVAHDNLPANNVYHRVGFVGLDNNGDRVEGVDPWLEVGFDFNQVDLGQW